ncbi:MAG: acetolactate synthase large subunit [Betaproteobacteria bacterium]|nr:MAG: acetolactate synthase large subunit [Betaproteobacteria bacterium]
MNGAESLVRTLIASDVNLCFANPGTSEMHFVAALDRVEGIRCVLGLFEGVVTGAADAYYRIAEKPASTLLHLGPGLGNGVSNLHNAKKARSGIVNIVGEHASYHIKHDAPLTADIEGLARPVSDWVKTSPDSRSVAADGALAVEAARTPPGGIATLILPADTAWGEAEGPAIARPPGPRKRISADAIREGAKALQAGESAALLLGGAALRGKALEIAGRIAARTGCKLFSEFNNARQESGAGRVDVPRLPFSVDQGLALLAETKQLVLVGAKTPVTFFAYPGKPSVLVPEGCRVTEVADVAADLEHAMAAFADELGATRTPPAHVSPFEPPPMPSGEPTIDGISAVITNLIPENAIVVDEGVTTGRNFGAWTRNAAPHDWMSIMGGSIGWGLAAGVGAALAAPDRKTFVLEGDGSAMYTVQALWTMARENLNVTVLISANRAYRILQGEFKNVGAGSPGHRARDMLTLDRPDPDWIALARGYGVEAGRATTLEELNRELKRALAMRGPYLVELVM